MVDGMKVNGGMVKCMGGGRKFVLMDPFDMMDNGPKVNQLDDKTHTHTQKESERERKKEGEREREIT
jgi:hypothetical protein